MITVYSDRSFTFIKKTPPASVLLRKAAEDQEGFRHAQYNKVGKVTVPSWKNCDQKWPDLTAADMDAAVRTIAGSARSAVLTSRELTKWPS